MKKCIKCGAELQNEDVFCISCGTKQPEFKPCPKCGHPIEEDDTFCTNCGNKIVNTIEKDSNPQKQDEVSGITNNTKDESVTISKPNHQSIIRKTAIFVCLAILTLLLVGAGGYYYIQSSNSSNNSEASDSISEPVVTEEETVVDTGETPMTFTDESTTEEIDDFMADWIGDYYYQVGTSMGALVSKLKIYKSDYGYLAKVSTEQRMTEGYDPYAEEQNNISIKNNKEELLFSVTPNEFGYFQLNFKEIDGVRTFRFTEGRLENTFNLCPDQEEDSDGIIYSEMEFSKE